MSFKDKLKRFFPASSATFHSSIERILQAIKGTKTAAEESRANAANAVDQLKQTNDEISRIAQNTELLHSIAYSVSALSASVGAINARLNRLENAVSESSSNLSAEISAAGKMIKHSDSENQQLFSLINENCNRQSEEILSQKEILSLLDTRVKEIEQKLDNATSRVNLTNREAKESVWANVFHDTVKGSAWYVDRVVSPGRWALGYQALYVLYRVLDIAKPQSILELGLGQSTKIVSQYAAFYPQTRHYVVEHDESWIDFYKKENTLPSCTEIVQLDLAMTDYKDAQVRVFNGFSERFGSEKFGCIIVDAPWGTDMKKFSRIDILSIIPDSLCEDFIIIVDDTNRPGETNTVAKIAAVLTENDISFKTGKYLGNKESTVICSKSLEFLCTL